MVQPSPGADGSVRVVKVDVNESFVLQGQDKEKQPDLQLRAGGALPRAAMSECRQ